MKIRPIEPKDNLTVAAIIRSCLTEYGGDHRSDTAWGDPGLEHFSDVYAPEGMAYWVAESDEGTVIAGVGIGPIPPVNVGSNTSQNLGSLASLDSIDSLDSSNSPDSLNTLDSLDSLSPSDVTSDLLSLLPPDCELQKMYCLPEYRGTGIAGELLETALTFARTYYKRCYLETMENMYRAMKFYEKHGFSRTEETLGDTGHNGCPVHYIIELK